MIGRVVSVERFKTTDGRVFDEFGDAEIYQHKLDFINDCDGVTGDMLYADRGRGTVDSDGLADWLVSNSSIVLRYLLSIDPSFCFTSNGLKYNVSWVSEDGKDKFHRHKDLPDAVEHYTNLIESGVSTADLAAIIKSTD